MNNTEKVLYATGRTKMIGEKRRFDVKAQLVHLSGNVSPHFSVQGEERNLRRRGDNQIEACGCMHDTVVKYFPELEPIVKVHLADDHGVPMHAVANGLYWLGLLSTQPGERSSYGQYEVATDGSGRSWSPSMAANHFRISDAEVRELRANLAQLASARAEFEFLLQVHIDNVLAPRWQADADAALALMTPVPVR